MPFELALEPLELVQPEPELSASEAGAIGTVGNASGCNGDRTFTIAPLETVMGLQWGTVTVAQLATMLAF